MKVYRIENKLGQGPYRGIDCETWETSSHNLGPRNPGPYTDFDLDEWAMMAPDRKRACVFGFRTLQELRVWFNKTERMRLRRKGYVIVRMDVEYLRACSPLQCAFVPGDYLPTVAK